MAWVIAALVSVLFLRCGLHFGDLPGRLSAERPRGARPARPGGARTRDGGGRTGPFLRRRARSAAVPSRLPERQAWALAEGVTAAFALACVGVGVQAAAARLGWPWPCRLIAGALAVDACYRAFWRGRESGP